MRSFAIVIRRAYFEAKKRRKYTKNVVVNRSVKEIEYGRCETMCQIMQMIGFAFLSKKVH